MSTLTDLLNDEQPAQGTLAELTSPSGIRPKVKEPGYIDTALTGVVQGGIGMLSGAGAAAEWAGDITDSVGMRNAGKAMQATADRAMELPVAKLEGPSFEGTFMENPNAKKAVNIVGQALPSLAAAMATGGGTAVGMRAVGMTAPKALATGSAVAAGGLGVIEGAPQYVEAKEAGKSKGKASAIGAAATIGTATLEYLGISSLLKMAGKGVVKGAGKGIITEGLQEGTQQFWQNLVAKVGYDKSKSLFEGMAEAIIGGSGAGGIVGAVAGRETALKDRATEQMLTKVLKAPTTVDNGIATAQTANGVVKAPVDIIAQVVAAGVTPDELATASSEIERGVTEVTKKTKINRLPDDPSLPNAVIFNVKGKEYAYAPKEGMSREELVAGLEGKSPGLAFNWLKKNSVQVKLEDLNAESTTEPQATISDEPVQAVQPGPEQVVDGVPEPLVGQGNQEKVASFSRPASPQELEQQALNEEINDAINIPSPSGVGDVPAAVVRDIGEAVASAQPDSLPDNAEVRGRDSGVVPEAVREIDSGTQSIAPVETPSASVGWDNAFVINSAGKNNGTGQDVAAAPATPPKKSLKIPKAFVNIAKAIDTVIKEDGVSEDFKRVPSFEAIAAYQEKYPDDSPDTAMSELAWMPEAEYDALTAVEEEPLFSQTQAAGTTTQQVEQELKDFLGNGFNNLVRQGKLEVVQGVEQLPEAGVPLYTKTRKIAGVYLASKQKVVLVADSIEKGQAKYVAIHEAVHALVREDKIFIKQKDKILSDFARLIETDASAKAALARVPSNTKAEVITEEALAHWLQSSSNHQHSLFKRVISAIKAALYRLGIAHGRLTASDMSALFTQGTQAWAGKEAMGEDVVTAEAPQELFSRIDDTLKAGQKKLDTAVQALKNPKSKLHDLYVQYAPQWLSVTPLHTLAQTFGKTIPQIRQFAKHLDAVVASKTEIVDTSAVLYEQAEKLAEAGVGLDVFNTAAATASFNRITPWADLYDQAWVPESGTKSERLKAAQKKWVASKMQKSTGMSYTQAYEQSRKAYEALKTEDLKQAYIKVVEHIASVRIRERNNLLAYIESVSEQGSELRANLMAQFEASFSNLHGAYWPLSRVGDFRMEYTDTEGFRTVKHYTTLAERREDKAVILEEGVNPDTIKEDYKDKQPRGSVAIPQMLMGQLAEAVEKKALTGIDPNNADAVEAAQERAQAITDDMNQIWLRWQPETSALKNSVRRKNVKGFSMEMLRSYLDYMQRHASNIAWTEQGKKIEQDIKSLSDDINERKAEDGMVDVTMQRHILNDLRNRIQALRSVSVGPVASILGKLGTAYYMTSPSIALVQMSQLGVLTLPKLSTMFGAGKATSALAKGTRDAFKKDYTRAPMFADPVVNTVYKNMREVVTDENRSVPQAVGKELGDRLFTDQQILSQMKSFTPYQMQLLTLREAMARNLLDISAAHEAYELTRGKDPKSMWNRAFKFAMLPMSLSELASRKATVLATYELAQQDGQDFFGTMNTIAEVVNDTLYSYSKENKGSAMQGGLSRVVLQFQHYRIMTGIRLAMLFRNAVKGESAEVKTAATKELVGVMGMSAALAGTMGLPLSGLVFSIMNLLLGDDDEPIDSELMYTNWLRETLGETAGDVVASGLPTLAGADLSGRIGLSGIYGMQNEPPSGLHGRNLAAWWAASQLGPIFSVGQGWFQGYDEIVNKGNYLKGLEAATPKPIKDGLKAYRIGTDGLKNWQGKRLLADEAIGPDEIVLVALGFNADEIAKAQSAQRSLNKISTRISERRGKLIRQAAQAFVEGDDASPALERIRSFNRSMPAFGINGGDIRPAIRKILVGDLGTTGPRESLVSTQFEVPDYVRE